MSPPLLLLAAPGSPQALPLLRALATHWAATARLPTVEPPEALRGAALAAGLVLHLAPDGGPALAGLPGLAEIYAPALPALSDPGALDATAWAALWRHEQALARRARLVVVADDTAALLMRLVHGVPATRLRVVPPGALPAVLPALLDWAAELPPPDGTLHRGFTLALNDYPVQGRASGGALRVRAVLAALDRETVLLTLGATAGAALLSPGVLQLTLPKSAAQRGLEADLQALAGDALEDIATALHAADHAPLAELACELATRAGLALFEHCYLAPLLPALRRAAPALPVVYDAHNQEAALKRELLRGHPAAALLTGATAAAEQALLAEAALVLACSEADARAFRPQARAVVPLPHGVTPAPAAVAPRPEGAPRLGFLGSAHPPNIAAARFILEVLAPALPEARFEIAGGVCGALPTPPANVLLHGVLPEAALATALSGWTLALNPVEGGGGASLKVADYLAHGLPSLSTPHAARGFPALAEGAGQVLPLAEFPAALRRLLGSPQRLKLMARAAREAAAALGWPQVAAAARAAIAALPPPQPPPAIRPAPPGDSAMAALLAEAPSARRAAAQRAALGLAGPYVLLLGEAAAPPEPPPGTTLLRHDGEAAILAAPDGSHRRQPMPLPALLLAPEPPCREVWLTEATAAAWPGLVTLAENLTIPVKFLPLHGATFLASLWSPGRAARFRPPPVAEEQSR